MKTIKGLRSQIKSPQGLDVVVQISKTATKTLTVAEAFADSLCNSDAKGKESLKRVTLAKALYDLSKPEDSETPPTPLEEIEEVTAALPSPSLPVGEGEALTGTPNKATRSATSPLRSANCTIVTPRNAIPDSTPSEAEETLAQAADVEPKEPQDIIQLEDADADRLVAVEDENPIGYAAVIRAAMQECLDTIADKPGAKVKSVVTHPPKQ